MIFSKVTKGAYEFNSLAIREDADGRMSVWAVAPSGCTAKTPCAVSFSNATPFGYMAQLGTLATATGAWFWAAIPEKTLTSAQSGMFQIGGVASNVIMSGSVTGTAGALLVWASATGLIGAGAINASSSLAYRMLASNTVAAGCYCYVQTAATTTHDIFLFGQMVCNNGA